MYNIKLLIDKMKQIANLKTNIDLAKELNVSYNTLNTWIKREKLPQEVILSFASQYNASLDFLLSESNISEKDENSLFPPLSKQNKPESITQNNTQKFIYYGEYEPLNIKIGDVLELNSTLLHSNGHYLLKYDDIYFIAQVTLNPLTNNAIVITPDKTPNNIDIISFKAHKIGIILDTK